MKKGVWWYLVLAFILGLIVGYVIGYVISITGKVITICGDDICNSPDETSSTCSADCNVCGDGAPVDAYPEDCPPPSTILGGGERIGSLPVDG